MGKFEMIFRLNSVILNMGGFILSFLRYPRSLYFKKIMKKNKELTIYKKSDRCYICGLGPSLKNVDFDKIDGDSIVVNRFILFDKSLRFKPTYYALIDEGFLWPENSEILIDSINKYESIPFVLNSKYYKFLNKKFKRINNLYYVCFWKGIFNAKKKIDYEKLMSAMGDVVCFSISLAIYLGYKEIILLGCDFNSFALPKMMHCYEEIDDERQMSLALELLCHSIIANTHLELEKYAKKRGIRIINATPGSLIDAYFSDVDYFNHQNEEI